MFTSLSQDNENYEITLDQLEATNTLIINSCTQFTFINSVDGDKETLFEKGIKKLCEKYTDNPIPFTDSMGKTRYINQYGVH